MGKRLKKGQSPPPPNLKAAVSKNVTEEIAEGVVVAVPEKRSCVHFDKGVVLDKLLENIKATEQIKCGECKEGLRVKKGSKGKVDSGKNGVTSSSSDPKSTKKAIWVCLDCGHFFCGGVGLPNGVHSHVLKHIRVTRHRLVMQCERPQLRWCFPCQSLFPFEREEDGEKKDLLLEVVKLIKEQSTRPTSALAVTESSCSGRGSVISETKLEGVVSSGIGGGKVGYAVRGLVNLGNTCYFNSVLQNLLSLDQLREHFLKDDLSGTGGPLVSSLKKLFAETNSEAGLFKSAINPKVFLGCVCSKAPEFMGNQQHDSHEFLRRLLDVLSIEESSQRKKLNVSDSDDSSTHQKPTLVDSIFGGEISSTVSCLECGHSSKTCEPFMDLSLSLPSKKPTPKKQQTISQAKKGKIPPKKVLGEGAVSKGSGVVSAKPSLDNNTTVSLPETPSAMALDNKQASETATEIGTECDSFWLDFIEQETSHSEADLVFQGNVTDNDPTNEVEAVVPGVIPANAPVSSDHQTLAVGTEMLMHGNDGREKPEPVPDEEDTRATHSNEDTAARGISGKIDEAQVCGYPDLIQNSSSANHGTDGELPLMVADSEILYMPYKDDISYDDKAVAEEKGESSSSSVSGHREHTVDYPDISWFFEEPDVSCNDKTAEEGEGEASSSFVSDGHEQNVDFEIGSLFDEPENSEGPVFGPPSKAGFMAVSGDSDPEELDDSGSPASVDGCLALFTKLEILSGDNAWECEKCAANLKQQRLTEKRTTREGLGNGWVNENGASSAFDECRDNPSIQTCTDLQNESKAAPSTELPNFKAEENATADDILGGTNTKQPSIASSATETLTPDGETTSSQSATGKESEDSEKVIAKRDASKSILVSKAPPVLTLHLKRFKQDARDRLNKLSGHVDFKEVIDLGQYMDSRLTEEKAQPVYRLAGLVEHIGTTMSSGHYVAYIRGGHKEKRNSDSKEPDSSIWYRASDSHVRQATLREVLRSEAYILFYERIY